MHSLPQVLQKGSRSSLVGKIAGILQSRTPSESSSTPAAARFSLQHRPTQRRSHAAALAMGSCRQPHTSRRLSKCRAMTDRQTKAQTAQPIHKEQLTNPAHIGSSTLSQLTVQDRGGGICLENYMTLPIEQYDELDPDMIRSLGGARYSLVVPRTAFFNVWVEPVVEVEVSLQQSPASRGVLIKATNWGLRGSDLIERLDLGRRFSLDFTAELTWSTATETAAQHSMAPPSAEPISALPGPGQVQGKIDLDVYTEVLGPFQIIPRAVLEAGGDAVMRTLAGQLLPTFLRRLAADYELWSEDPVYRLRRSQRRVC